MKPDLKIQAEYFSKNTGFGKIYQKRTKAVLRLFLEETEQK
jgi:hypothetical protein